MLKILLPNECAIGKSLPCQFANGAPGIENGLLTCFYRVGKLRMMTLKIEPFQALKAGEKPGFG